MIWTEKYSSRHQEKGFEKPSDLPLVTRVPAGSVAHVSCRVNITIAHSKGPSRVVLQSQSK